MSDQPKSFDFEEYDAKIERTELAQERARAAHRAKFCKSRVAREPVGPGRYAVRIDGRYVGYLYKAGLPAHWGSVYDETGARVELGPVHGRACALNELKVHVMRQDERRVAAELALADEIARDLWPRGLIVGVLLEIRANMLAGGVSPAVATMNAVHVLAHVFRIQMEKQWQERSAKEHADAIALLRAPGLQSLGISAEDRGSDTRMDRYSAREVLRAVAEMLLPLKQQLDRLDAHVDANQGELAQQVDLLRAALREVRP